MSSRFIQGDGYPTLLIYNDGILQSSVKMPYVRDQGNKSYIRQYFDSYPEDSIRNHKLLSGSYEEDLPIGYNISVKIKYPSILATQLREIYNTIMETKTNNSKTLMLQPRHDLDIIYPVIYNGGFPIESDNMWNHVVMLEFQVSKLIENPTFIIPN